MFFSFFPKNGHWVRKWISATSPGLHDKHFRSASSSFWYLPVSILNWWELVLNFVSVIRWVLTLIHVTTIDNRVRATTMVNEKYRQAQLEIIYRRALNFIIGCRSPIKKALLDVNIWLLRLWRLPSGMRLDSIRILWWHNHSAWNVVPYRLRTDFPANTLTRNIAFTSHLHI